MPTLPTLVADLAAAIAGEDPAAVDTGIALVEKYGKVFEKDYGWAAKEIHNIDVEAAKKAGKAPPGVRTPNFNNIDTVVEQEGVGPIKRWADACIHASGLNPSIVFENPYQDGITPSGPSNAGIDVPAYATLECLRQSVGLLTTVYPDEAFRVQMAGLKHLVYHAGSEFAAIQAGAMANNPQGLQWQGKVQRGRKNS